MSMDPWFPPIGISLWSGYAHVIPFQRPCLRSDRLQELYVCVSLLGPPASAFTWLVLRYDSQERCPL